MQGYSLTILPSRSALVSFDLPGKVNIMNDAFMAAMDELMATLENDRHALKGVILTSAKSTFFAGGDLDLMRKAKDGQQQFLFSHFERLKRYFRRLERLGLPVVAAINGTALGGGFELCLACHRRIALSRADTRLGLPEVGFGILPGAGGVIRLTALLGLMPALGYLVTGRTVDVATALAEGLIDAVAENPESLIGAAEAWIVANPVVAQPWDRSRDLGAHRLSRADRVAVVNVAPWLQLNVGRNDLAALRIADIAAESLFLDFDTACRIETRGFVDLVLTDQARDKISAFFNARAVRREPAQTA